MQFAITEDVRDEINKFLDKDISSGYSELLRIPSIRDLVVKNRFK